MRTMGLPASEVIDRFVRGEVGGTAAAVVPGGRRLRSTKHAARRGVTLMSYATEVAFRAEDQTRSGEVFVAVTPRRYSPTTSKQMTFLRRALRAAGFVETTETTPALAKVPGRWGGYGPAWAEADYEMLPFVIWRQPEGLGVFGDRCECGQPLGH